jgi:hypothetical protein
MNNGFGGSFWGTAKCSISPQHIAGKAVNFDGPVRRFPKPTQSKPHFLHAVSNQTNVIDFVSVRRNPDEKGTL